MNPLPPMDDAGWHAMALRRTPMQSRSRDKLARAIAAAEELVRREGVDAISLPRVAAEAGVSVGALYQYLPDREAITMAIVARYHGRLEQLFDAALERMPAEVGVTDAVGRLLRSVADIYRDEEFARSLGSVRATTTEAAEARRAHKQRMAAKVREMLGRLGLLEGVPAERAAAVARVVFTSADAVMHEAFAAPEPERGLLLEELERAVRAMLGA